MVTEVVMLGTALSHIVLTWGTCKATRNPKARTTHATIFTLTAPTLTTTNLAANPAVPAAHWTFPAARFSSFGEPTTHACTRAEINAINDRATLALPASDFEHDIDAAADAEEERATRFRG